MILIASALFPPETVVSANLSYDIALELATNNEVVVLSPKPTRPYGVIFDESYKLNKQFEHVVLNSYTCSRSNIFGRFRESYSLGRHLAKYVDNNHQKISVIYANIWPLFAQRALLKNAEKYDIPVVLHVQDIYPESLSEKIKAMKGLINILFTPIDRKNLELSTHIVTISEQMKGYLIKTRRISKDKFSIIHNWQNDSNFVEFQGTEVRERGGNFRFLYLGTINITAGVDLLIHAFSKADMLNASLIIAGDGPDKERCIQIAKKYNKNIRFKSASPKQVPELQAESEVLLLPLKKGVAKTALPSKMTAYMMSGKPIIASIDEDSGAAEIIKLNDCGWVVEAENEDRLIRCMQKAREADSGLLKKMGDASLQYAKNNLSKVSNLHKISSIINKEKRSILC
jgi:glycosyltransferase involved in cell wall biosynthesis